MATLVQILVVKDCDGSIQTLLVLIYFSLNKIMMKRVMFKQLLGASASVCIFLFMAGEMVYLGIDVKITPEEVCISVYRSLRSIHCKHYAITLTQSN